MSNELIKIPDELPKPAPQTNKHIPIETILDLRRKKLSCSQIACIVGCCKQNIQQRLKDSGLEHLETHKKYRADILALKSREILESIDTADIKKAGLRDRVIAYGTLYDKERLELDKATSIIKPLVTFGTEPIDITPETALEDAPGGV